MSENQFVGDLTDKETEDMAVIIQREHQVRETLRMTIQAAQDKANDQMMLVRADGAALWRKIGERLGVDVRVEVLEMHREQGSGVGKVYRRFMAEQAETIEAIIDSDAGQKPMSTKEGEADAGETAE